MSDPKYKVRQRFMIDKAIYVIQEIKYDTERESYLYIVHPGLFGYYEDQLKSEYFNFKEPKKRYKRLVK